MAETALLDKPQQTDTGPKDGSKDTSTKLETKITQKDVKAAKENESKSLADRLKTLLSRKNTPTSHHDVLQQLGSDGANMASTLPPDIESITLPSKEDFKEETPPEAAQKDSVNFTVAEPQNDKDLLGEAALMAAQARVQKKAEDAEKLKGLVPSIKFKDLIRGDHKKETWSTLLKEFPVRTPEGRQALATLTKEMPGKIVENWTRESRAAQAQTDALLQMAAAGTDVAFDPALQARFTEAAKQKDTSEQTGLFDKIKSNFDKLRRTTGTDTNRLAIKTTALVERATDVARQIQSDAPLSPANEEFLKQNPDLVKGVLDHYSGRTAARTAVIEQTIKGDVGDTALTAAFGQEIPGPLADRLKATLIDRVKTEVGGTTQDSELRTTMALTAALQEHLTEHPEDRELVLKLYDEKENFSRAIEAFAGVTRSTQEYGTGVTATQVYKNEIVGIEVNKFSAGERVLKNYNEARAAASEDEPLTNAEATKQAAARAKAARGRGFNARLLTVSQDIAEQTKRKLISTATFGAGSIVMGAKRGGERAQAAAKESLAVAEANQKRSGEIPNPSEVKIAPTDSVETRTDKLLDMTRQIKSGEISQEKLEDVITALAELQSLKRIADETDKVAFYSDRTGKRANTRSQDIAEARLKAQLRKQPETVGPLLEQLKEKYGTSDASLDTIVEAIGATQTDMLERRVDAVSTILEAKKQGRFRGAVAGTLMGGGVALGETIMIDTFASGGSVDTPAPSHTPDVQGTSAQTPDIRLAADQQPLPDTQPQTAPTTGDFVLTADKTGNSGVLTATTPDGKIQFASEATIHAKGEMPTTITQEAPVIAPDAKMEVWTSNSGQKIEFPDGSKLHLDQQDNLVDKNGYPLFTKDQLDVMSKLPSNPNYVLQYNQTTNAWDLVDVDPKNSVTIASDIHFTQGGLALKSEFLKINQEADGSVDFSKDITVVLPTEKTGATIPELPPPGTETTVNSADLINAHAVKVDKVISDPDSHGQGFRTSAIDDGNGIRLSYEGDKHPTHYAFQINGKTMLVKADDHGNLDLKLNAGPTDNVTFLDGKTMPMKDFVNLTIDSKAYADYLQQLNVKNGGIATEMHPHGRDIFTIAVDDKHPGDIEAVTVKQENGETILTEMGTIKGTTKTDETITALPPDVLFQPGTNPHEFLIGNQRFEYPGELKMDKDGNIVDSADKQLFTKAQITYISKIPPSQDFVMRYDQVSGGWDLVNTKEGTTYLENISVDTSSGQLHYTATAYADLDGNKLVIASQQPAEIVIPIPKTDTGNGGAGNGGTGNGGTGNGGTGNGGAGNGGAGNGGTGNGGTGNESSIGKIHQPDGGGYYPNPSSIVDNNQDRSSGEAVAPLPGADNHESLLSSLNNPWTYVAVGALTVGAGALYLGRRRRRKRLRASAPDAGSSTTHAAAGAPDGGVRYTTPSPDAYPPVRPSIPRRPGGFDPDNLPTPTARGTARARTFVPPPPDTSPPVRPSSPPDENAANTPARLEGGGAPDDSYLYGPDGYDAEGYDRNGFDRDGNDRDDNNFDNFIPKPKPGIGN